MVGHAVFAYLHTYRMGGQNGIYRSQGIGNLNLLVFQLYLSAGVVIDLNLEFIAAPLSQRKCQGTLVSQSHAAGMPACILGHHLVGISLNLLGQHNGKFGIIFCGTGNIPEAQPQGSSTFHLLPGSLAAMILTAPVNGLCEDSRPLGYRSHRIDLDTASRYTHLHNYLVPQVLVVGRPAHKDNPVYILRCQACLFDGFPGSLYPIHYQVINQAVINRALQLHIQVDFLSMEIIDTSFTFYRYYLIRR